MLSASAFGRDPRHLQMDEAKAEVEEIVGFLRDAEKYSKLGGRLPKGLLNWASRERELLQNAKLRIDQKIQTEFTCF